MNTRTLYQKDYYRVLGVPTHASAEEIKKAFKKQAFQYHPDRTQGNHGAEDRFKEVSEAYHVLTDEQKRKNYDATRRVHYRKTPKYSRRTDYRPERRQQGVGWAEKDLLRHLFFDLNKKEVGFQSSTFEQIFFGKKGIFFEDVLGGDPQQRADNSAQDFRINSGQNGAKASPSKGLLASVGKKLSGLFLKKGNKSALKDDSNDLHFTLPITMYEAIRGGEKQVTLKRGENPEKLLVKIPPGIKPGMKLRLKGKGKQNSPGGKPGDLYFKISVQ